MKSLYRWGFIYEFYNKPPPPPYFQKSSKNLVSSIKFISLLLLEVHTKFDFPKFCGFMLLFTIEKRESLKYFTVLTDPSFLYEQIPRVRSQADPTVVRTFLKLGYIGINLRPMAEDGVFVVWVYKEWASEGAGKYGAVMRSVQGSPLVYTKLYLRFKTKWYKYN